jgi:hemoglobin
LGGYDALTAINDAIAVRVVDDPDFDKVLAGVDEESGPRVRQLSILHLCEAAGGDCTYIGRDLKTLHAGMGITDELWQSFMGHLGDALNELNVADPDRAEVISIFSDHQEEIVDSTQ